jgi:hypothetical protein
MTDRVSYTNSSPSATFYLEADVVETDPDYGSNGGWRIRLYVRCVSGGSSSFFNDSGWHAGRINGSEKLRTTRDPFLPVGVGAGVTRWRVGPDDNWVAANSNGYWSGSSTSIPVQQQVVFGNVNDYRAGSVPLPRIAKPPGKPGKPVVSNITPTGAKFTWTAASRGNANINDYGVYVSTSSSFATHVYAAYEGVVLTKTLNTLLPGTTYYMRTRAKSADGTGVYSDTVSFTTLPSTPAGLTSVTPTTNGQGATVVMTPPSGISSVNSYTVERRTPGGSWVVAASGSANPSQLISGLTPGQTYEWRVAAVIGTYTSPYSTPTITVAQPQPNASPGSYWDGSTPDTPTTNYAFTGAAGSSTSTAQNLAGAAIGWLTGAQAVAVSGGSAVQYQVAGALEPNGSSGTHAVRYVCLTPATANGFRGGPNGTDGYALVTVGGFYMGSIWVEASRQRVLAATLVWLDAVGAPIAEPAAVGVGVTMEAGVAQRLTVLAQAPAGAVRATVWFTDPAGSSMMQVGDTIDADAAMISTGTLYPYFDGDTPDTEAFIYEWDDVPFTSPSFREDVPQAEQNPLQDPNCDPLPIPPSAPVIEDDCIVPIGSWRRTWYTVDAGLVPEHLVAAPTVTLQTFGESESQVRIRWYANPDCTAPLDFDASEWQFEQVVSWVPANTTMTLDGVARRVWAEVPTGSAPIAADSLVRGTGGVPATWPLLTCGSCWLISLDTAPTTTPGNLVVSAGITVRE